MKRKLFVFATVLLAYSLFVIGFSLADNRGQIAAMFDRVGLADDAFVLNSNVTFSDPTPEPLRPVIQHIDPTPEPQRAVMNRVDPTPDPPRPVIKRVDPTPDPPRP